jgi:hypothetical protein
MKIKNIFKRNAILDSRPAPFLKMWKGAISIT